MERPEGTIRLFPSPRERQTWANGVKNGDLVGETLDAGQLS